MDDTMKPMTVCRKLKSSAGRLPAVSLVMGTAACLVMYFPSLAERLQYHRAAVSEGQLWRVATCHLTHWSFDHLFWDVAALLFLGVVIEQEKRRRLLACISLSALFIPLAICLCMPELATYRGLSGIDSAVFMLLAITLLRDSWAERDWCWTLGCTVVIAGFVGKIGFEYATGTTLFVDSTASRMVPIPLAHVVGAAVGVLCGIRWEPLYFRTMMIRSQSTWSSAALPP